MRFVSRIAFALLALVFVGGPASAQVVEHPLPNGWVVALPADVVASEGDGVRKFLVNVDQGGGRLASLSAGHSTGAGLPTTADKAAAELRRRVDALVKGFEHMGEVRVHGIERCDRGRAVGLEARVSVRNAKGEVLRVRTRLFLSFGRFFYAAYAAVEGHYSPRHAQAFLDSLRDVDTPAATTVNATRR